MFNSLKALKAGNINSVDVSMAYPLLRWCSGSTLDLKWCSEVNKTFWWLPKDISLGYLYLGLKDKSICKYPKAIKENEDNVLTLKKELAKKYFSWSSQELDRNLSNLAYLPWEQIANDLGIDDKSKKLLGITILKQKKVQKSKKAAKSLLDFM